MPRLHQQRLIAKTQRVEVSGEAVFCRAVVLVRVARVAALLPAVPEEPAGTEEGTDGGQEVALPWLPAQRWARPGTVRRGKGKSRWGLWSVVWGGSQAQPGRAHLCQCGSLLSTAGLPTTISRALALVMATLNL